MLLGFLNGLAPPGAAGEGWLILSDFAEHLGLRAPGMLADAIAQAGLEWWRATTSSRATARLSIATIRYSPHAARKPPACGACAPGPEST
jgi:hypothetical protein